MIMCGRAGMALRLPEPFHHYRARGVEIRIAVFHTAAGAVGVDQLAGMAAEDVPFAGLGSPCAETGGIVGPGGSSTAVVATGRPCGSGGVSQGGPTIAQSSAESWVGADFL